MASIFLSGTFEDLRPERNALLDVFQRVSVAPISQEFFGASPNSAIETIRRAISNDECYLYLLVLGFRYGSLVPEDDLPQELKYPPNTAISYSEMEFDMAGLLRIPRLVYLKSCSRRPNYDIDRQQVARRDRFIKRIGDSRCTFCKFRNKQELAVQGAIDIMKQLNDRELRQYMMGRDYEV